MDISSLNRPNFAASEFFASEAARSRGIVNLPPKIEEKSVLNNLKIIADKIQEIRGKVGLPFSLTSGYRCPILNKVIKGSPNSWHMKGLAIDGLFVGKSPEETAGLVLATRVGFDKMLIERGCVHLQFHQEEKDNRNYCGFAELVNGEWVVRNA